MRVLAGVLSATIAGAFAAAAPAQTPAAATLVGFASLPPDTFLAGPTAGQFIVATNGRTPPFLDRQPVQGFSAAVAAGNGEYFVISDNGFGSKANSRDHLLHVYRIAPAFRGAAGGAGTIRVVAHFVLRDPDRRLLFPIVAEAATYPESNIPVDPSIRRDRLLTGADTDIESFRRMPDGTFWFGDEFGPMLIHADASGKVLQPPVRLPGVRSPQDPQLGGATPTLAASRGFEGLGMSPDGKTLYPMLEGAIAGDDPRRLRIYEFYPQTGTFGARQWSYRLDAADHSIGDLTGVSANVFIVAERDDLQGEAARFKKIFAIDLTRTDADGFVVKREVADLLNIADPDHLGGTAAVFRFPFQTIESLVVISPTEIGVLDDNNYPFSSARTPGQPDPTEFILIRLARSILN
ncbi:MAG TPA: esterase-like activity of phytase family protein [Vicinamibacterales bacterium]|nr:esterase-like activity of phytase family protein [Vicinamibacterales bacterium]